MAKIILFAVFLLTSLVTFSQVIMPIEMFNPIPQNKQIELVKETWQLGSWGIKSTALECSKGDTIFYTITRSRKTDIVLSVLDATAVCITKKIHHKENIITGAFTIVEDGTILIRLHNRSYFGNTCNINIKKKKAVPIDTTNVTPQADKKQIQYCDSVVFLQDTSVYLACSLNFNQPTTFSIPILLDTIVYKLLAIRTIDVALGYGYSVLGSKINPQKTKQFCSSNFLEKKSSGTITIYLQDSNLTSSFMDSYRHNISVDINVCEDILRILPKSHFYIVATNTDKVVGKYVRIQLFKIVQIPCKPVMKNGN